MSKSNFCSAPFSTLIINADGKVGCCRELGTEHSIGNAFDESIEDIWNGEKIRSWRREFLTGEIKTCAREMNDMNCNLFKHNVEMLPLISMNEFVDTPILRLSPDINGECNLECPMCTVWKKPNGEYDKVKNFWANLEKKIIPNLKIMDPLSGEPFIQKDFYKIIEITARVNPDCRWNFTTNGQWELTGEIKESLDKIKINLFSVSIDSIDHETYRKIRRGGELQSLLRNLDKLKKYCNSREQISGKVDFYFNFTIQKQNAYQIKEMLDFCYDFGAEPILVFLYEPKALSIEVFSDEEKKALLGFYFEKLTKRDLLIGNRVFSSVIRSLRDESLKKRMFQFYNLLTDGEIKKIKELGENPFECANRFIR